jgi:peptide deformylase
VVAKGFNMYGEPVELLGEELLARIFQHETDHLNGILFVDRLDKETRKKALHDIKESEWFGISTPEIRISPHSTRGFGY